MSCGSRCDLCAFEMCFVLRKCWKLYLKRVDLAVLYFLLMEDCIVIMGYIILNVVWILDKDCPTDCVWTKMLH